MWELDLASFASVKAFAVRAERELERVDVAFLNAGYVQHAIVVRRVLGGG